MLLICHENSPPIKWDITCIIVSLTPEDHAVSDQMLSGRHRIESTLESCQYALYGGFLLPWRTSSASLYHPGRLKERDLPLWMPFLVLPQSHCYDFADFQFYICRMDV